MSQLELELNNDPTVVQTLTHEQLIELERKIRAEVTQEFAQRFSDEEKLRKKSELLKSENAQRYRRLAELSTPDAIRARAMEAEILAPCYKKDQSQIYAILLTAEEKGLLKSDCLNSGGLNVIKDKVSYSAKLISFLIINNGHTIRVIESTDTKCTIEIGRTHPFIDVQRVTYTREDAIRQRLWDLDNWQKMPTDMLRSRATTRAASQVIPEVMLGVVGDFELDDDEQNTTKPEPCNKKIEFKTPGSTESIDSIVRLSPTLFADTVREYCAGYAAHYAKTGEKTADEITWDLLQQRKNTSDVFETNFRRWAQKHGKTIDANVA